MPGLAGQGQMRRIGDRNVPHTRRSAASRPSSIELPPSVNAELAVVRARRELGHLYAELFASSSECRPGLPERLAAAWAAYDRALIELVPLLSLDARCN